MIIQSAFPFLKLGLVILLFNLAQTDPVFGQSSCKTLQEEVTEKRTRDRFLDKICFKLSTQNNLPHAGPMRRWVHNNFTSLRVNALRGIFMGVCAAHIKGVNSHPMMELDEYLTDQRDIFDDHYPLTLHQSNFTLGVFAMGMMHSCLASALPGQKAKVLALTMGSNAAAQVFYELDMGHGDYINNLPDDHFLKRNVHRPEDIGVDLPDLTSGALGIASYYAVIKGIEYLFGISFHAICAKSL